MTIARPRRRDSLGRTGETASPPFSWAWFALRAARARESDNCDLEAPFVNGRELWITDGNARGARRVADLWPGSAGSDPDVLGIAGGTLFLTADDGVDGRELWTLTPNGTAVTIGNSWDNAPVAQLWPEDLRLGRPWKPTGRAAPGAPCWLMASAPSVGLPTPFGGALQVDPLGMAVIGTTVADRASAFSFSVPIPGQTSLRGACIHAQTIFVAGPDVMATPGLELTVGQ